MKHKQIKAAADSSQETMLGSWSGQYENIYTI